jgi:hypothetical protein
MFGHQNPWSGLDPEPKLLVLDSYLMNTDPQPCF